MKLSDYVIDFLARKGISHVFGISGGAAVHLFDSAARHPAMDYVCTAHEQSAALAADGYARVTGKLGGAVPTSGPGATTLLPGTCCSFYDSVPTLMITGQVATFRLKGERPVRQVGFQETDVVSIFSSVTKYAHQIRTPESIRYHLEKAYHLAFARRPGSVLIDLPDDLQRAEVDPARMEGYEPPETTAPSWVEFEALFDLLRQARRPAARRGARRTRGPARHAGPAPLGRQRPARVRSSAARRAVRRLRAAPRQLHGAERGPGPVPRHAPVAEHHRRDPARVRARRQDRDGGCLGGRDGQV